MPYIKKARAKTVRCKMELGNVPLSLESITGSEYDCLVMGKSKAVSQFKKKKPKKPNTINVQEDLFAIVCFNYEYGKPPEKSLRQKIIDAIDWVWDNNNKQGWNWIVRPLLTEGEIEQIKAYQKMLNEAFGDSNLPIDDPKKALTSEHREWIKENIGKVEIKNRFIQGRGLRGVENHPTQWENLAEQMNVTLFPSGPEETVFKGQLNIIFSLPPRGRIEFAGIEILDGDVSGKYYLEKALQKNLASFYRACLLNMTGDIQRNLKSCVGQLPESPTLGEMFPDIFRNAGMESSVADRFISKK